MTGIKNEQINIIPILISSMKKIKQSKVLEKERQEGFYSLCGMDREDLLERGRLE